MLIVDNSGEFVRKTNRRLALFLDGTWNSQDDNTNVWRLKCLCSKTSEDESDQLTYYATGIAAKEESYFCSIKNGAFGVGIFEHVVAAYEWLVENYQRNDRIFIFGFSRGAFTARCLAGLIAFCGLPQRGSPLGVQQIFNRYKNVTLSTAIYGLAKSVDSDPLFKPTKEDEWIINYSRAVNIEMIGVFDTVGALGIPNGFINEINSNTYKFLSTGLYLPQLNAFHAVALDECRKEFLPTLWTRHLRSSGDSVSSRQLSHCEQRWFAGAHANVGGGYSTDPLPQFPLSWMISKAKYLGLSFSQPGKTLPSSIVSPVNDSFKEFRNGFRRLFTNNRPIYREVGMTSKDNISIENEPINETIDGSVFEKIKSDKSYTSTSLNNWAARRGIELNQISGSVIAASGAIIP